MCSSVQMLDYCREKLISLDFKALNIEVEKAVDKVKMKTAWRIEGTLREFPKFNPVNLWFDYPVHRADDSGALQDIQPEEQKPPWQRGTEKIKKNTQNRKADRKKALEEAVESSNFGDVPTVN